MKVANFILDIFLCDEKISGGQIHRCGGFYILAILLSGDRSA
jgi:hypothetical protein